MTLDRLTTQLFITILGAVAVEPVGFMQGGRHMKVYIVTAGDYSDYHIVAVFANQKKAELYCATHNKGDVYEPYYVEEWETEDTKIESKETPKYVWHFNERRGEISVTQGHLTLDNKEWFFVVSDRELIGHVTVRKNMSEKMVKKIIADKIAKYKAECTLEQ